MQEFNFVIEHCPGKENVIAATLSRRPIGVDKPVESCNLEVSWMKLSSEMVELKNNLRSVAADQREDFFIRGKIDILERSERTEILTERERKVVVWYKMHKGLLFRKGGQDSPYFKLCVPKNQILTVTQVLHAEIGHFGWAKTFNHIRQTFFLAENAKIHKTYCSRLRHMPKV